MPVSFEFWLLKPETTLAVVVGLLDFLAVGEALYSLK